MNIQDNQVSVRGAKGELKKEFLPNISIRKEDKQIIFEPKDSSIRTKQLWGTYRTIVSNMIEGVSKGFEKRLEINGVGYRAEKKGEELVLKLGFSHPVLVKPKEGIKFEVDKNIIIVSGIDKEKVGETASAIRAIKKPDPYKGKGIRYEGEVVRVKPGKKVAGGEGK